MYKTQKVYLFKGSSTVVSDKKIINNAQDSDFVELTLVTSVEEREDTPEMEAN